MIRTALFAALATGTVASATVAATSAAAQATIGNTDSVIANALRKAGYDSFRVIDRDLARTEVEACVGTRKFRASVNVLGIVKRKEARGACDIGRVAQRETLSVRRLNRRLTRAGFTDVEARPIANGRFMADACRDGRRMRMRFEATGERIDQNAVGRCANGRLVAGSAPRGAATVTAQNRTPLEPRQVRQKLRGEGFDRIRFTDRELPVYIARACDTQNRQFELRMNRFGEIANRRLTGDCGPRQAQNQPQRPAQAPANGGLNRAQITQRLTEQGFTNVRVTKVAPPIQAQACRRSDAFEMTLNRLGEIINQRLSGNCKPPIDQAALETQLRQAGFSRLEVQKRPRGFFATGCQGTQKLSVTYNPQGEQTNRKVEGSCQSQTVAEVVNTLQSRGARNLEVVLEGCFREDRYRWRFNQLGDRLGRERVGPCN